MRMLLMGTLLMLSLSVQAQDTSIMVVKKSDLPAALVQQLEAKNSVESTLQNYGKWAGMGKEIGVALREGLGALNDETNRFADTKVGFFVMFIIAFKVLGNPIIQLLIGIPLLIFGTVIFIVWFKKMMLPNTYLVSKDVVKEEGKILSTTKYTYVNKDPIYSGGAELVGVFVYVVFVGICITILFAH